MKWSITKHTETLTASDCMIPDPLDWSEIAAGSDRNHMYELREKLGISQGVMADLLGVARSTYCAYEGGAREIPRYLCRLLDQVSQSADKKGRGWVAELIKEGIALAKTNADAL